MSLYVHSSLEYTVLSEMSIVIEYLECVFIEVNTRTMTQNKKIIVGMVLKVRGLLPTYDPLFYIRLTGIFKNNVWCIMVTC